MESLYSSVKCNSFFYFFQMHFTHLTLKAQESPVSFHSDVNQKEQFEDKSKFTLIYVLNYLHALAAFKLLFPSFNCQSA